MGISGKIDLIVPFPYYYITIGTRIMHRTASLGSWLAIAIFTLVSGVSAKEPPTVILHHGKILTVDAEFSVREAIALREERIVAVGSNADVLKLAGSETKMIDLQGKMVLPGLIDSHTHPTGAAMFEYDHPIPEMETIGDVLGYIKSRTDVLPKGEWIVVRQVFITRLRDQRYPNRKELDLVAPDHPVVFSTGPDASLNSLALSLSGIDKEFQVPEGSTATIERDENGEPTGILRNAMQYVKVKSSGKSASAEERSERLKKLFADYNSVGITSIADRAASEGSIELYRKLRNQNELTCRVYCYLSISPNQDRDALEERFRWAAEHPLHDYDNMVWLRGIKVFLDGGMLTGSAYLRQPWGVSSIYSISDPDYRGLLFIQPERLETLVELSLRYDLQFTAHSVGDGAVETLVAAYAAVNERFPIQDHRPCITHCNFMSRKAIEQMKELKIVADLQPAWLYLDGKTLLRQFGEERLIYFQPYRTLFEEGVIVGGGSDHMQKIGSLRSVNPYNPWLGIWTTLTREPRWMEGKLHEEQCLSREQALRLYTINNAWLTFEENQKGSLEPGKLADLIVIDRDYLTCSLEEIRDIQVEQTWLGGKLIYQRK